MDDLVASFVMAGGKGSRLEVLTRDRSKSAVNIFGHYRIVDLVTSNVVNSDIPIMLIGVQFLPISLSTHMTNKAELGFSDDNILEILSPFQDSEMVNFEGTADSVRKNYSRIENHNPKITLILGGDHIYSANYQNIIKYHKSKNADLTIMTTPVAEAKISDFGIIKVDNQGKVMGFTEKPEDKDLIEDFRLSERAMVKLGITDPNKQFLASMGNYVFFNERLKRFLEYEGSDFGKNIIPSMMKDNHEIYAFAFEGYWRDVGKVNDYFDCNMEFAVGRPLDLNKMRVRTHLRQLPGAWVASNSSVGSSILSPGNEIYSGSSITNSVFGYQIIVEENCTVNHCVFTGADRNNVLLNEEFNTTIGKGSKLKYVILDKNVQVGRNVNISPDNALGYDERIKRLESIGLTRYEKKSDNNWSGDFYLDEISNILVIGKQKNKGLMIPDNFQC